MILLPSESNCVYKNYSYNQQRKIGAQCEVYLFFWQNINS